MSVWHASGRPMVLRALFVIYIVATAVHVGWVLAHQPFYFDAWNVMVDTQAEPVTVGRFFEYWWHQYTHSNPRIGQPFAYLGYKLEHFSMIAAPLAYLAMALAVFVLGTARWPRWRVGRDLALVAIAIGFLWFALPEIGLTLFDSAYGANYFFTATTQLWFLVVLRLHPDGRATPRAAAAYFVFGVVAGACNEHSGPTLAAFMVGYAWWTNRKTGERPLLAWAGAIGVVLGFCAIFFAPGQEERYEGLGTRQSLISRILRRGVSGNLDIISDLVVAAAPLLALLVIVVLLARDDDRPALRRSLRFVALALAAALLMTMTLFASPLHGSRFFQLGMALLLAGFIGVADVALRGRLVIPFVVLAIAASAYAAARSIPLYTRVARASDARMDALDRAAPGSVFLADAFEQVDHSWWFPGDDFRDPRKREMVAKYFGLGGVVFRAYDNPGALGLSGIRFVPRYELDPPGSLDDHGGFSLATVGKFDLGSLHVEMRLAVDILRARLGTTKLRWLELEVVLDDPRARLPRPRILVGRWTPAGFEAYVGQIIRAGRSRTRNVRLPTVLATPDVEVFVYKTGDEARRLGTGTDKQLTYQPWKLGVHWILACRTKECFVIAATRH